MLQTNQIDWLRKTVVINIANNNAQVMRAVNELGSATATEGELINSTLFTNDTLEFGLAEVFNYGIVAMKSVGSDLTVVGTPIPYDLDPNHEIGARLIFSSDSGGAITSLIARLGADIGGYGMGSYAQQQVAALAPQNSQGSTNVATDVLTSSIRFIWPRIFRLPTPTDRITREMIETGGLLRFFFQRVSNFLDFRLHYIILDYNVLNAAGPLPPNMQPIKFNGNML